MRKGKLLRRIGAGALVFAATTAALLGATGVALAAPPPGTLGSLTVNPGSGSDLTAIRVTTSAGCSSDSDAYNVLVQGPGAFASGYLITSTGSAGFSTSGSFDIFFGVTMKDAAADLGTTLVVGEYPVIARCVDEFSGDVKGTFTASLYFTSPTAYQTTDPNAPVTTSTALSVSPSAPVSQGTPVTLTATVTPSSAAGTVQFKNGTTNVGSPVAVSGGTASLTTSALPVGANSLTAVFTGSSANISGSTSPAVSYQVTAPVATPTTTALSVNPTGSVAQYQPVTLTGSVSPAGAAGTIQFRDNGGALGSPVALSGGTATFVASSLAVGAHSFTAQFVPADPAAFAASQSGAVALEVTAFTGVSASENITTTVLAGELLISVENQNVVLPSPQLTPDATKLTTSGSLNPITVTDTRAGNPGWSVSGQVSDFSDGASHAINGANLGWSPLVVDKLAAQNITAGPVVAPAAALAPGVAAPSGFGLAASRTLATAAAAGGNGTAHLSADIALNVPTSTVAGTYTAVLTLTAI
ncbi:Ig-like domain-containing protein [Actinophytocola sp.]|uniref:Ig-like domain-containing protein n=1 Tax=Actinophytocola sp. TaxID=1872138 RepID=UPI002ED53FB1